MGIDDNIVWGDQTDAVQIADSALYRIWDIILLLPLLLPLLLLLWSISQPDLYGISMDCCTDSLLSESTILISLSGIIILSI